MKNFSFAVDRFQLVLMCLVMVLCAGAAQAEDPLRGEALLVWGTNDPQSPDPKHIPVDADLARKLSKSPYRWKYYFKVSGQVMDIPVGDTKKGIFMSKHCSLEVKNLGNNRIEVKLFGEGKQVSTNKESFVDNWPLIFAGPAKDETAWLVVLRKVKSTATKSETAAVK